MKSILKTAVVSFVLCIAPASADAGGKNFLDNFGARDAAALMVLSNRSCGTAFSSEAIGSFALLYADAHNLSEASAARSIARRALILRDRIVSGYLAHDFCEIMMREQRRFGW